MPIRRVVAAIKGEVSIQTLQAHQRAGAIVYDLLNKHNQTSIWRQPPDEAMLRVCVWNAFALQLLADKILEANDTLDPLTAGFVPPQTHQAVLTLYETSSRWYKNAQQAKKDSKFQPSIKLPASIPGWKQNNQLPRIFVDALLEGASALQTQALARMADFERIPNPTQGKTVRVYTFPANHPEIVAVIKGKLSKTETEHSYAMRLLGQTAPNQVNQTALKSLMLALNTYFQLGQWMAMPSLIKLPKPPSPKSPHSQPGFWRYSDPDALPQLRRDNVAKRAIEEMWDSDPNPNLTEAFHLEIEAAWAAGQLERAIKDNGKPYGHHRSAPFAPILEVLEDLELCQKSLSQGDIIALEAYRVPRSGEFRRKLVVLK